jgi:hypothetical protein
MSSQATIDAALADLARERAALDADVAEAVALEQARLVRQQESAIDGRISQIALARTKLANVEPKIGRDLAWRETLTVIRAQLSKELLALPPRIRDAKTLGEYRSRDISIRMIDGQKIEALDGWTLNTLRLGQLMKENGVEEGPKPPGGSYGELPWFGDLKTVEARLTRLRQERDDAQHRLDSAKQTDEDRAARLAEIKALNAKPQRKVRGDGSKYDKYPDGTIVELDETT